MHRRSLLHSVAAGLTAVLAGCHDEGPSVLFHTERNPPGDGAKIPRVDFNMEPVTDLEIARRITYPIHRPHNQSERELANYVIADGSVLITSPDRPAPAAIPFVLNDAVYELSYETIKAVPATFFTVTLKDRDSADDQADVIAYDALPEVDKAHLRDHGWDDGGIFGLGGVGFLYYEDEINESLFVPEPAYSVIKWDNETYGRIAVDGSTDTEVVTYEYTAQQVHASAEAFGRDYRKAHAFALSELTDDQEAIIEAAMAEATRYRVQEGEPPEAFDRLKEQFVGQQKVERVYREANPLLSGKYLVRYDGAVHWTELYIFGADRYE